MSTTQTDQPYEVVPARGPYDGAYHGICLHPDCQTAEGASRYRTSKKGSPGQAEAAVRDHLRDKHGIGGRR